MTANHATRHPLVSLRRTHVFDLSAARGTHVFDPALVAATPLPLRYTLAGFPPGNLRAGRGAPCG